MSENTLKQLKALRSQLRSWNDTLDYYQKAFEADGNIDAKEKTQLDKLKASIYKIEEKVSKKQESLNFKGKISNTLSGTTERVKDYFSSTDDIVDHSLVDQGTTTDTTSPDVTTDDASSSEDDATSPDTTTEDASSSEDDKYAAIAETPAVKEFLAGIHKSEGGYVDDPNDPGGKTKFGIAEKREWPVFAKMFGLDASNPSLIKDITKEQVDEYYIKTRFEQNGLDEIKSAKVVNAIFDQSILTPGIVKKNMKRALVALDSSNKFPINNAAFSAAEITAINSSSADKLVENFVEYQNEYYNGLVKKNPAKFKKYINGWMNRTARLTGFSGGTEEDAADSSDGADAGASDSGNTFEVPSGWGLNKIASEKGITVEELKSWNADKLKTYSNGSQGFNAGETIVIKGGGSVNTGAEDDASEEEVTAGGYIKPAWVKEAFSHEGKKETAKMVKDDPWVKLLFEELGAYGWAKDQTVSDANWCAAFVSYCLKKAGKSPLTGFDGMRARTYGDKYGKEITRPVYGALAVVARGGSGHIGFVIGYNKANGAIRLLGGNQGNAVSRIWETRQLLAYRVPSSWKIPEQNYLD